MQNRLGAVPLSKDRCLFRVWAPHCAEVDVHLVGFAHGDRCVRLIRDARGYHQAVLEEVPDGALYFYRLDGKQERPDPASRSQPQGVHGPSQVIRAEHCVSEEAAAWRGLPLSQLVIYELHIGTYSSAGTFYGVIEDLDRLCELGVNAIELMPVAQFPGERNWGYDGVYLYAVQGSYGGALGLKRLIDACHRRGIAVILDVVYNHLGPEGNYLAEYAPYFTDRYRTSWGGALNLDGPHSDEVRAFLIENACSFVRDFHIDGLRLDAVHALYDCSARPFLRELASAVQYEATQLGRPVHVIAESDSNDARLVTAPELGGYGLSAQWSDDVHHALHTMLTSERNGYYADFGELAQLEKALREGFVYTGEYAPTRKRRHGSAATTIAPSHLVVYAQSHDQVGNRMFGERLSALLSEAQLKLAAATVLLSPFVPMLFMGEEYGEAAPFQYFVSHGDEDLIEAVRRGRRAEFAAFAWQGEAPDPQCVSTFLKSRLNLELRRDGVHAQLLDFYKQLIKLRRSVPSLGCVDKQHLEVRSAAENVLLVRRELGGEQTFVLLHFGKVDRELDLELSPGRYRKLIDSTAQLPTALSVRSSAAARLSLSPFAVAAYIRERDADEADDE